MLERTFVIKNKTGLHARPAAQFVQKAASYKSTVKVKKGSTEANAKSLISILCLGAGMGTAITITADGEDENDAINGILDILSSMND